MQTHINPATDQLPASAVITLDQPEQFRTGQLNVETLTLDAASHVRFSGSNWADGGKFMERDYDYPVTTPLLRGPVRDEALRVSEDVNMSHVPALHGGPDGHTNALGGSAVIADRTPDTTAQITAEATNPEITDKVLPLAPVNTEWNNTRVPTRLEQDHAKAMAAKVTPPSGSAAFLNGLPRETPTASQSQQVQAAMTDRGVPAADRAAAHWSAALERNGGTGRAGVDQAQLNASMARHPSGRGVPVIRK